MTYREPTQTAPRIPRSTLSAAHRTLGEAHGAVPANATVFDTHLPAIANLNPDLLNALHQAATDAAHHGITFTVNGGWRSPEYQQHLLQEAITTYGSATEAARWVATPDTSPHVSGHAIDLGPTKTTRWLSTHGSKYGLCQIFDNEPWHYELRPEAITHGCPPRYPDPSHDPRMRR
ncbi:M15 family metallopeptidase [Stackebrandtia nassauensis]|uniref:Peptidase M15B and M15C DD-carboxypeptidase VanY/endolysin n=1 Tax=Stackebrandtia nassauensis (strain DSM 44728 / CIP 108903 / NRRL B-16338 / NBRC 102104 / LLR-40K-21) TaxID=446470 RepID=D3PUW8_STANL|nr:M15 family metallopeptidase [Stackebrandtia nassauensis]ADD44992.1 peptidase M15B and M15C DD-carboxypeptidase VanY/endolysin [Stackebrandtia nassauensis DSM 44728]